MNNSECAVYILSSRKFLLKKCLDEFWDNYNFQFDLPLYIYFFSGTYDKNFTDYIKKDSKNKIQFIEIFPRIPKDIPEKEIFYNRDYNSYVKKHFSGKKRVGYLFMERFCSNITSYNQFGCITDHLKKYNYLMRIDDDSWFRKKINFNLFKKLEEYPIATAYTWNYVNENVINTRENLWNFYLNYISANNIVPRNEELKKAVLSKNENKMHKLHWSAGNCNLYNIKMFRDNGWEEYIKIINESNGQFKYRWGDIEVINLFGYTYFKKPMYDYDLRNKKLYLNKFFYSKYYLLSLMAPSPDNKININFIFFKFRNLFFKLLKFFRFNK